jgi:SH3 domain-containing protein
MLSPSDILIRPTSLNERLTAEAPVEPPPLPEPTPTIMAERFAPEAQRGQVEAPVRPRLDPPVLPGFVPQRRRNSAAGRGLLVASLIVSLVPTALILLLLWQGAIKLPMPGDTPNAIEPANAIASVQVAPYQVAEAEHAAMAVAPALDIAPAEPKPEIVLTVPGRIAASTGDELDFDIAIDSDGALPARSVIAIRAMPSGASFSQGRPYGTTEWNLRPDEIGDLKLKLPKAANGSSDMRVELMAADGSILASATTKLDIAADPRAALILRAEESGRVAGLIAHGQKMIEVGYFAGARAYFKRAAEAGSGDAALLLGATYDPEFIDKIGAHGIKPDPKEAASWYDRAKQLGVEGAEAKLKALKEDATTRQRPVQATEAAAAPRQSLAEAEAAAEAQAQPDATASASVAQPSRPVQAPLPTSKGEWVAMLSYANVRAAPSITADTLRVAEKGAKLLVTGREGNWVQVTDPATSEVGWVYSRFIETAEAPAR